MEGNAGYLFAGLSVIAVCGRACGGGFERSENPFAIIVLGHLRHQQWCHDAQQLKRAKLSIIKDLLQRNWPAQSIRDVFKFLDWVLALPDKLEEGFEEDSTAYQRGTQMKFISPWERRAMERGHQKGMQKGLQKDLQKGIEKGLAEGAIQTRQETLA